MPSQLSCTWFPGAKVTQDMLWLVCSVYDTIVKNLEGWEMRIAVLSLCMCCTLARAGDVPSLAVVGDWNILVDETTGDSCFAQKDFEDGTRVQIGFDILRNGGFFAAYNSDWTQIEEGGAGTAKFEFGDARFAGDATGRMNDDLPGGYAFFDNPDFVDEFAKRNSVKFSGESGVWFEISLSGTGQAIAAVRNCQKDQSSVVSE